MALRSRAYFKARFIQGYTLTAQDYADWLDSYWHQQDTLPDTGGTGGGPTTIAAANVTLADAANNFDTDNVESALVQLYNALQQAGSGGAPSTPNANQVPVADAAEVFDGTNVEAVLLELYNLANAGGSGTSSTSTKRALLSTSGITVDVEYIGTTAPTLSGSGGNYTLTIPNGTSWLNAYVEAVDATQATASNNFSFTVANANTDNGVARKDRCIVQLTNLDTGQIVEDLGEFGIDRNQTSNAAGQVTNLYTGVGGAFDGFAAFFTR